MGYFSRKRRLTNSQRVVLSAFFFSGMLIVLIAGILWSASNPTYYSYEATSEEIMTQQIVARALNS